MTEYYAIAHHGTAGPNDSYGYAEVVAYHPGNPRDRQPVGDLTMTVSGPYLIIEKAQAVADEMNKAFSAYAEQN